MNEVKSIMCDKANQRSGMSRFFLSQAIIDIMSKGGDVIIVDPKDPLPTQHKAIADINDNYVSVPDYEVIKQAISARIATLMRRVGYNQSALAKHSGMSESTISKVLTGKSIPRKEADRSRIAQALGTTTEVLFAEAIKYWSIAGKIAAQKDVPFNAADKPAYQKSREMRLVIEKSKLARQARIEQINQPPPKHRQRPIATCQRGVYYFKRKTSSVVAPRCCTLDECLVRG